ncbi:MAG: GNAT family N-acetyltransferase [Saprospiraceae bacterium]
MEFSIEVATNAHLPYAEQICDMYAASAKERGTGIAQRKPEYIREKMQQSKAVIAFAENKLAGFCYIETWSHEKYVANSGLIINPAFRKMGLAKAIKQNVFQLARDRHPSAKVFGITTSLAVMKINSELGYRPVTFSELTQDEAFWKGCQSCPNYDILTRNDRRLCLCTGMLAPSKEEVMQHDLSKMIITK